MKSSHSNRFLPPTFVICFAPVLAAIAPSVHAEGLFTNSGALGTTDQTANVGLSTSKTYIQAIDLGDAGTRTVNGVVFTGSGTGANPSGTGWAVTAPTRNAGGGTFIAGSLGGLTDNFVYGGNPETLTLTGLTVGETYSITCYNRSWDPAGGRVQTFTASGASTGTTVFDQDIGAAGSGNLNLLRYTFQAGTATQAISIAPAVTGSTFHFYGFSNEQVFNKSWSSGTDWTSATWGPTGAPNGVGTNASFPAQGSPTSVNLDASQTVGHVQFDGANAWTLSTGNASALTLQTDVGGVSVLSAKSGVHTISTPVTFASNIMKSGPGTVALSGAITDAGKNIHIGAGTLEIANSAAQSLTGVISGTGTFAKSGAGILTLTKAGTYSGNTVISGGVLKLQAPAAAVLGTAAFQNFANYNFNAAPNNLLAGLKPATGSTNVSAGAEGSGLDTVLTDGAVPAHTLATAYTVGNSAVLTYSLGSSPTGYDLSKINLFTSWANNTRVNINLTSISYSTVAAPGTFTAITGSLINYGGGGSTNLASLATTSGVLATGVSSVRFNYAASQQNNYVGYRELEVIGTATGNLLPITSPVQIASGASLDLSGNNQTIASLADSAGTGGSVINSAASTLVNLAISPVSGSTNFSGAITDSGSTNAISLIKSGGGTQVLSGTSNYAGTTILSAGVLNVATLPNFGVSGSLGNRAADSAGNVGLLFRGGTLQYTGSTAQSTNRGIRISTNISAIIDASGSSPSATLSFTAPTSADFFENSGARGLILTGTNTGDNTFGMAITQAGSVTNIAKNGVGTWILTGANSYGGTTALNAGTLRITTSAGLGTGSFSAGNMTTIANNAALELQGDLTIPEHFHLQGAGPAGLGVLRSISGNSSLTTNFALDNNSTFGVDAGTLTIPAQIYHDTGSWGITKIGAGTLALSGNNIYSGATTIKAGTLTATGGSALLNTGAVSLDDTAGAIFNLATSETIGSLAGGGITGGNVTLGAATLTTGEANTSTTYAGVISGTGGALVKTGTGTLTLTGVNTYTGDTTVSGGTLAVNGTSIADSGKLVINGGKVDIAAAANETVDTLYIGTTQQLAGTYGSTASAAVHQDDSRFSGTGIVTVVAGEPYDVWISGYPSITGSNKLSSADPDFDGFTNLQEYAFDTNPSVSSSGQITYAGGIVTGHGQPTTSITNIGNTVDFRAVFGRRQDYVAAGLTYTVQFSAGLDIWVNSSDTPTPVATDGTIDAVSVPYPLFIPTANGVEKPTFFRVGVSSN
ncbi:MAG: autotransporter-associated beta strand repeat-containing protein [Verrucomicrobiota bacterium]